MMRSGGGAAVLRPAPRFGPIDAPARSRFTIAVNLGDRPGSPRWWRGLVSLGVMTAALTHVAPPLTSPPLAVSHAVMRPAPPRPIARVPRPASPAEPARVDLAFTVQAGEGLSALLLRQGSAPGDVSIVAGLVAHERLVPAPGTAIAMTLGPRPAPGAPRPIARIGFGARIDLAVAIARQGGRLVLARQPIAVDRTPLRITGTVGDSLYRAARTAGVPVAALAEYLRAIVTRVSIDDIAASDRFDIVLDHVRAVTGEEETGRLLYAGLTHGGRRIDLMRWTTGDTERWYDASGEAERSEGMALPVDGKLTSAFGMRFHPILGFTRMHQGVDLAAPEGTPIVAAADGRVTFAGWHGGHGNYVLIDHGGGTMTGYGHMSRFAVAPGDTVTRGEPIGYVGSTGLSTGPHCHFEVFENGVAIDPATVDLATVIRVPAKDMGAFEAKMAALTALPVGSETTTAQP